MGKVVTVRGWVSDPTHIELDQAVTDMNGPVEVVLRALPSSGRPANSRSVLGLCADLGKAPSAAEIDDARREMWGTFPRDDV